MGKIELSNRLRTVANYVTKGNKVADIGCDHGFVSIYLLQKKKVTNVIAMDINKGPLERAKEHILFYGLENYIETRLSDGIKELDSQEADTLIIAGLGGRLMVRILQDEESKVLQMKELVLQPQSEIELVRRYLRKIEFQIVDEKMVFEEEKFYTIIHVIKKEKLQKNLQNKEELQEIYDKYGEQLIKNGDLIFQQYLKFRKYKLKEILNNFQKNDEITTKQTSRINEIKQEIEEIGKVQVLVTNTIKEIGKGV